MQRLKRAVIDLACHV